MTRLSLLVNDQEYKLDIQPEMPLLWVLRDLLQLTGTKYSCGIGLCGACTAHLDGEAIRTCTTPASAAVGRRLVTIEGLSTDLSHPLQQAWLAERVSQCGYCQPGQVMAAAALLARNPQPTEAEIAATMSEVLCRCGTYQRIRQAILRAIETGGEA